MKDYQFIRFATPCSVRGEFISVYEHETNSSQFMVCVERNGKVLRTRPLDSHHECKAFIDMVESVFYSDGVEASHKVAVDFIRDPDAARTRFQKLGNDWFSEMRDDIIKAAN